MVSLFLEETLEKWWEYDRRKESTSSLPWFSKKCRWDWEEEEETTSSDHINFLLREFEITILGFLGAAGQLFSGGILSSSFVGVLQSSSSSSSEEASRIFFFFSSSSLETCTELIICSLDMGVVVVVAVRKLEERERGKRLKHTHPTNVCVRERERVCREREEK